MVLLNILFTEVRWFWLGRMSLVDEEVFCPFVPKTSGRIGRDVLARVGVY